MEDSFSVRVDKTFGALRGGSESSSVGVTPALWSLTDDEIERREWNRDKVEDVRDCGVESGPSDVRNRMDMDLQELSEEEEEEEEEEAEEDGEINGEKKKRRRSGGGGAEISAADEYLEVQSNIGRDPTLDYEEEEDEYDKVAVGTKRHGDRIYMRDVKVSDYAVDEPSGYGELPDSLHDVVRDPRANHMAAKMRLKEDAEAAGNFDTLQLSDNSVTGNAPTGDHKKEDSRETPKPILKRTENSVDSRAQKRVRFLVDPKSSTQTYDNNQSSEGTGLSSEHHSNDGSAAQEQSSEVSVYSSGIPDYVRNPSKYTRYTFDASDDMNDKSNQQAYMDFFRQLGKRNKSDSSMDDGPVEIPKSVAFVPRRKTQDESAVKKGDTDYNMQDACKNKSWSIGVTAEDAQESEISAMEEDEPSLPKPGRQYRTRAHVEDVDDA